LSPYKTDEDAEAVVEGEAEFDYPAIPHEPKCSDPSQFIWSLEKAVFPESFVDSTAEYDKAAPPPKYLTREELLKEKFITKETILNGFKKMKSG
jgi:hypothetical protein